MCTVLLINMTNKGLEKNMVTFGWDFVGLRTSELQIRMLPTTLSFFFLLVTAAFIRFSSSSNHPFNSPCPLYF